MDLRLLLFDFYNSGEVRLIFALILLDMISGIMAALRLGVFDWQRVALFYRTNVVPGILGYAALWLFAWFGLDDLPGIGDALALFASYGGAALIGAGLIGSITDNFKRMNAPVVPAETDALGPGVQPSDPQG